MKKPSKRSVPKVDPYLEGLMGKLLERLMALEKKMDTLISQAGRAIGNGHPPQNPEAPPRRERTLYEAICADCHKVCEVPFRPTEARPVYCKECWSKRKAGGKGPAFPVLTPVALSPKPKSQIGLPPASARETPKKAKKSQSSKKSKKKR